MGIRQLKVGLIVIKFALVPKVLRVVTHIAARIIKLLLKLFFMRGGMATHTEVFFRVGEFVDFFAVFGVTAFARRARMVAVEGKSGHAVVIKSGKFASHHFPALGRMTAGTGLRSKERAGRIIVRAFVTGLAGLCCERGKVIKSGDICSFGRSTDLGCMAFKAFHTLVLARDRIRRMAIVIKEDLMTPAHFVVAALAELEGSQFGRVLIAKPMVILMA